MDRIGRAILARERGSRGADGEERNLPVLGGRGYGEADAGVRAAEHHGQPVAVGPFAKFLRAEIGLVLVIECQQFDRFTQDRPAEIGDRHLGDFDGARTLEVGIGATWSSLSPMTTLSASARAENDQSEAKKRPGHRDEPRT